MNFASAQDHAACRLLIRGGSKSFYVASLLLPSQVRKAALALYAFCRLADDTVDEQVHADPLRRLRERLDCIYRGAPHSIPADRAVADAITHFAIPRALPEALLEGFEWDTQSRRFETPEELNAYAARVAGTVGAMMACLMGARAQHIVARACDLGVAMQLTNIARDVGEDARAGRLYLPLQWLREAGVDPDAWLRNPCFTAEIAGVVQRLLNRAQALYERATHGIGQLPRNCRAGIYAARLLYAEIGDELARRGLDSVSQRTVVPLRRKAELLARALLMPHSPAAAAAMPPLAETRFLVDAVLTMGPCRTPATESSAAAVSRLDVRVAWLVDLFERLERREHVSARGSSR